MPNKEVLRDKTSLKQEIAHYLFNVWHVKGLAKRSSAAF